MNIKSIIKEVEGNRIWWGIAVFVAIGLLMPLYKLGAVIGDIAYQLLGK